MTLRTISLLACLLGLAGYACAADGREGAQGKTVACEPMLMFSWDLRLARTIEQGIQRAKDAACTGIWMGACPDPAIIEAIKKSDLTTWMNIGMWSTHDLPWLAEHPEQGAQAYWATKPHAAKKAGNLVIALDPGKKIKVNTDDVEYWWVVDETAGRRIGPDKYSVNLDELSVAISNASRGHRYRVYYLGYDTRTGSLFHPQFAKHCVDKLEGFLSKYTGVLDYFLDDGLAMPYRHDSDKGIMDYYGYQYGVSPVAQEMFRKETGIGFDPRWLTPQLKDHLNAVPSPEYSRWIAWQIGKVREFRRTIIGACHKAGVKLLAYWGDAWVGAEPRLMPELYDAVVKMAGVGSIDAEDPTKVVVTTLDSALAAHEVAALPVPSPHFKRIVQLWVYPKTTGLDIERCWVAMRRAILANMPDGVEWGVSKKARFADDDEVLAAIRKANIEFNAIHKTLNGAARFKHKLNLYVVNSWGDLRAWVGWPASACQKSLMVHLMDMPVNVKFTSFADVADKGIPSDADVLLLYGNAGTAWSGGDIWKDEALVRAVETYVRSGGGIICAGGSGISVTPKRRYQLAGLTGLDIGRKGPAVYRLNTAAGKHWISDRIGQDTEISLHARVSLKAVGRSTKVLLGSRSAVALAAREYGKGRAVYIRATPNTGAVRDILLRSLLWAAGQESRYGEIGCDNPGVIVNAYPSAGALSLYVTEGKLRTCTIRISPDIFVPFISSDAVVELVDVINDKVLGKITMDELKHGTEIDRPMNAGECVLLRLRPESSGRGQQ